MRTDRQKDLQTYRKSRKHYRHTESMSGRLDNREIDWQSGEKKDRLRNRSPDMEEGRMT